MGKTREIIALVVLVCLISTISATADTLTVGQGAGYLYNTIQSAIAMAGNGDTIQVAPGTYTGAGNIDIDTLGKAITIKSSSGASDCIIDCQNTSRAFNIHSGESSATIIDGLSIINGNHTLGGGMRIDNSSPTIKNCIIKENYSASSGGLCGAGMYLNRSASTIINTIFDNNTAQSDGGGIFAQNSNLSLISCVFSRNTADDGCVIFNLNSDTNMTNSIVWGNYDIHNSNADICNQNGSNFYYAGSDIYPSIWNSANSMSYNNGLNKSLNPLFVDGDNGDYRLLPNSPCIDAGAAISLDYDIEGNYRPYDVLGVDNNGAVADFDMGAYELVPEPISLAVMVAGMWLVSRRRRARY